MQPENSTELPAASSSVMDEATLPESKPSPDAGVLVDEVWSRTQHALQALDSIEHSAHFVASDVSQLLDALRAGLRLLLNNSLDHMTIYKDTAEHTHKAVTDVIEQGHRFIRDCESLDERMMDVQQMAVQLGVIDLALTSLEADFERCHPSKPKAMSVGM